jgi:hypothetical protein
VHASGDGHVTGSVAIPVPTGTPRSPAGGEPFGSADDRHFVIVVSRGGDLPGVADVSLFQLTVPPDGRPGKPGQLNFDSRGVPVTGAALSQRPAGLRDVVTVSTNPAAAWPARSRWPLSVVRWRGGLRLVAGRDEQAAPGRARPARLLVGEVGRPDRTPDGTLVVAAAVPGDLTSETGRVMTLPSTLLRSLAGIVGEPHVLTGDATAGFATDWTGRFLGHTPAVVRPRDTAEVAAVLALCTDASRELSGQLTVASLNTRGVPMTGSGLARRYAMVGARFDGGTLTWSVSKKCSHTGICGC